jgi:polyisoprenoid-binding protein YceI
MARYRIDPARSHFTVQAFAAGLLSAFAHSPTFVVRDYQGEFLLQDTAQSLEVEVIVNPASLDLQDRISASDRREIERRMWDEVLETSAYREVSYRGRVDRANATGQGRYQIALGGELTLRGVTHPHRIDAELIVFADGLRLGGGCPLRMSDYRIKPVTAVGGTIKLKDELRLSFDIAALPEAS